MKFRTMSLALMALMVSATASLASEVAHVDHMADKGWETFSRQECLVGQAATAVAMSATAQSHGTGMVISSETLITKLLTDMAMHGVEIPQALGTAKIQEVIVLPSKEDPTVGFFIFVQSASGDVVGDIKICVAMDLTIKFFREIQASRDVQNNP